MMETIKLSEIVRIASNVSLLLPLFFYLRSRHSTTRPIHIIGLLVIVSGLSDMAGYVLMLQQQSTIVLFNLYYMVLFGLLTWFYYRVLFAPTGRVWAWLGSGFYVLAFIAITAFAQPFSQYQTLLWLVTAVIMIIYSVAYFFYSLSGAGSSGYFASGNIWINIGVMIYFVMNLYLFVMGDYVLTQLDAETSALIWSSHNLNNILKNTLFAIGFFFAGTQRQNRNSAVKANEKRTPVPEIN